MLKHSRKITSVALASCVAAALFSHGCHQNNEPVRNYLGTTSPGDVWTFSLDRAAGTFTASTDGGAAGTIAWSMSGSLAALNFQFLEFTITTVTSGAQMAPSIAIDGTHNIAYGMEVPGLALIVQSPTTQKIIASIYNPGSCTGVFGLGQDGGFPAEGYSYVRTSWGADYDPTMQAAYGALQITPSDATHASITGETDFVLNTSTVGSFTIQSLPTKEYSVSYQPDYDIACNAGLLTLSNGASGTGTVASAGLSPTGLVFDEGSGNGGLIAFPSFGPMTSTFFANFKFNGIAYVPANANPTQPVQVVFDSTATQLTVSAMTGPANSLTVGQPLAFLKVDSNNMANGILNLSECADATFTSCTLGLAGGSLSSPSGLPGPSTSTSGTNPNGDDNPYTLAIIGTTTTGMGAAVIIAAVNPRWGP